MKIGLLGGTFDPPHQGHLHIAKLAIKKLGLDQLWLIPTVQNPLKDQVKLSFLQRFSACQELAKDHPRIHVKNYKNSTFFTYDLIKKIKQSYSSEQFYWIMGDDCLDRFYLWKNQKRLIKSITIAIFPRKTGNFWPRNTKSYKIYQKYQMNYCKKSKNLPKYIFINGKRLDISSSQLKKSSKSR